MKFNYRVLEDKAGTFSIHKVFYYENGKPVMFGEVPEMMMWESMKNPIHLINVINEALSFPVMKEEDFEIIEHEDINDA